ncbi:MAG: hypothetical protein M1836_002872 [Candelina mexicana]|nr:MAG: hypothetical protein M1836_002872 [Candelina mexicana]
MSRYILFALMVFASLNAFLVSGIPADSGVADITRAVDCKAFDTPESCNTFCAAVHCFGHRDVLTRLTNPKLIRKNRTASGAKLREFNDEGIKKYGTWRRNNNCVIADEYPLATSYEGGAGLVGSPRAIIQGASKGDQSGQSNWANKVWNYNGLNAVNGQKIKIEVYNWDPALSPYCEAREKTDKSICKNKDSPFFQRSVDESGPHGKAVFNRIGLP